MTAKPTFFRPTWAALATAALLAACGGGDAGAPAGSEDTTAPTVAITDNVSATNATGAITFTFTFSEAVTGFTADDIVVTGGTKGAFSMASNNLSATLVVTPAADSTGTVEVSVAAEAFGDFADNLNTAGASAEQAFDTTNANPEPPEVPEGLLSNFDTEPLPSVQVFGGATGTIAEGPEGGNGGALKVTRDGGEVWAGAWISIPTIPSNAGAQIVSARVYSPIAGIPMVAKAEWGENQGSGNVQANQVVVAGWQTLTWTFSNLDATKEYNRFTVLPQFETVGTGESFYFDDITVAEAPPAPPPADNSVLANFDDEPLPSVQVFGGAEGTIDAGPAGGNGNALKVTRNEGEPWAGAWIPVPAIPSNAGTQTVSARVYSPTAGIPMVVKAEYGDNQGSGNVPANEAVVEGWQTLTWTFSTLNPAQTYNRFVVLPQLETVGSGQVFYFDDITVSGSGGSTDNGDPSAEMGSAGAQTMPIAQVNDQHAFIMAGDAVFASDYIGELDANGNHAGWTGARTAGIARNGNIGFFQDPLITTGGGQVAEVNGWVTGNIDNSGGVGGFFRFALLRGPASTFANSYMGLYVNAPNNGTLDVSSYGNIKFKLWGPAEMYQQSNLNPVVEIILAGPKVAGCTSTGSGGTEISKNITANQKIGAGSSYTTSLAGWTVKGVCGGDTNATAASSVLANLARFVVNVPGSSFNFTNPTGDPTLFATGVNLGPIAFTN